MEGNSLNDIAYTIEAEWRILKLLEAKGFPWAPKPRGCSLAFDNPLKYPFIVLDWIEGDTLYWGEEFPSQPLRDKLLDQLAEIQMSLLERTLNDGMSSSFIHPVISGCLYSCIK